MIWLVRLFLAPLGWLKDIAGALLRWVLSDWRHPPLLALALCTAAYVFVIDPRLRSDLADAQVALADEVEAHNGTIAQFVVATREAERRQAANVQRVQAQQAEITGRIEHDFQAKLTDLRTRHAALAGAVPGRMRGAAAPQIDPGSPGHAGLPGDAPTTGSADQATGDNGLSLGQRLIASEQALQLDALIDWVLAQAAVQTSPVPEFAP